MPLELPNLDDRTFEDLLEEARLRIARYCPEWTDFNDSDPGMAIVQLFAWLSELMIYKMNKVPERNYLAFLKLLNLERRPAVPARAQLVFSLVANVARPTVVPIPSQSKFIVSGADGQSLVFETTRAIDVVPYPLNNVQVYDGSNFTDVTQTNLEADKTFAPFSTTPQPGYALYLGFEPDSGAVNKPAAFPAEINLYFFAAAPNGNSTGLVSSQASAQPLPRLVWEYQSKLDSLTGRDTPTPDRWRPLTVYTDTTQALTHEGTVTLAGPGADCAINTAPSHVDDAPRFWIRCRIVSGQYPQRLIPTFSAVRANVVEVVNRATFRDEIVGQGTGAQTQFNLRNYPIEQGSLYLVLTDEENLGDDSKDVLCVERDDFTQSTLNDLHYVLNATTGAIEFGNGKKGKIPDAGKFLVARRYRAGGGSAGNVEAGTLQDPPAGMTNIEVTNLRAAQGGQDEESVKSLLERAPLVLRGDRRAVTASDYRTHAEDTPGVGRAIVLPLHHPEHPGLKVPGAVTVLIIANEPAQSSDATQPALYLPKQELLQEVARRLEACRPLGTELLVAAPRYRRVVVRASVTPGDDVTLQQSKLGIERALADYFRPDVALLSDDRRPTRRSTWQIGTPFHPSRLYEVILSAKDSITGAAFAQDVTALSVKVEYESSESNATTYELDPDELIACYASIDADPTARRSR